MSIGSRLSIAATVAASLALGCAAKEPPPSSGGPAGAAPKTAPDTTAARVEVASVEASRPVIQLVRPGEVEGAREARLASALGGFVEAVKVEAGDRVERGAVVALVDASTHNAQAALTQVEVDDAERELARIEGLGKAIPSARLDAARTRVARARAQHALSTTRQSRAVIRAPFAGVVVDLDVERGEVVAPGAPLLRLIQLEPARIAVSVADRDVGALSLGDSAYVTAAGASEPVEGTVKEIEPAADLRTRTFLVEVEVPNPDHALLPGMIAKVTFASQRVTDAIMIPQDVVVTRLEGNGVFVVGDGNTAVWRPLQLGAIVGTQVEVASGLEPGERVVVLGQRGLADGDAMIITRDGTCCRDGRVVFSQAGGRPRERAPLEGSRAEVRGGGGSPETAQ